MRSFRDNSFRSSLFPSRPSAALTAANAKRGGDRIAPAVNAAVEPLEGRVLLSGTTGQIFVANSTAGTIGEYTSAGEAVNASLVQGLGTPATIEASGSNIFVANLNTDTIGEYTTAGATVNAALITGLNGPGDLVCRALQAPRRPGVGGVLPVGDHHI